MAAVWSNAVVAIVSLSLAPTWNVLVTPAPKSELLLNFVWVVIDGKATRRPVELGVRTPGLVEALTGVEAGEQVVVGGQERLSEGAPAAPTVVDRTPASGREGGGGTSTGQADTAGKTDTTAAKADSGAETREAGGADRQ